jgi:prepilin-type processing-associated H-X9-DG protein
MQSSGLLTSAFAAGYGASSYAVNFQVFGIPSTNASRIGPNGAGAGSIPWQGSSPKVPDGFPDGASQTILIGEKFATCAGASDTSYLTAAYANVPGDNSANMWGYTWYAGGAGGDVWYYFGNMTMFAALNTGPTLTFQVQPSPYTTNCDITRPSTGHPGGMNVCMGDASVRSLDKSISPVTFWAACTPAGNDRLGQDW